jgi:hypothetical protein
VYNVVLLMFNVVVRDILSIVYADIFKPFGLIDPILMPIH